MKGSNHLTSHCPERSSFPADKMIPKDILKMIRRDSMKPQGRRQRRSTGSGVLKKMHRKKSRVYNRNIQNFT